MNNRLLFVTPYFPPASGSGVQRGEKFVKYLMRLGWDVRVITIDHRIYPHQDPTLSREIRGARVREVRLAQVPGVEHKVLRAVPALRREVQTAMDAWPPDVVLMTAPDYHWLAVGQIVRAHDVPFVLDYPDPWAVLPEDFRISNPPRAFKSRVKWRMAPAAERWCLQFASAVVFATQPMLDEYVATYPWLRDKAEVITNGFDEEDFGGVQPDILPEGRIRVAHIGSFAGKRSPLPAARAVGLAASMIARGEERLELSFTGSGSETHAEQIEAELGEIPLRVTGWLPHAMAIREVMSASILWLDAMVNIRYPATGKIFEYLRSGKPIFALAHKRSPAVGLIESFGAGRVISTEDPSQTGPALADLIRAIDADEPFSVDPTELKEFQRSVLTDRLSEILSRVAGGS